jgi:hypothetical protein
MWMNRDTKAAFALALSSMFISGCCQTGSPCENTTIGPSTGEVVGIAVGAVAGTALVVGTVVAVNHDHHTLKGCVSAVPDGLQLTRDSDKKVFSLIGTADIKPGEKVKLHGTKQKKRKSIPGNQQFFVERVTKDLGQCQVSMSATTPGSVTGR